MLIEAGAMIGRNRRAAMTAEKLLESWFDAQRWKAGASSTHSIRFARTDALSRT
jgi:hypothetical protein